MWRQIGEYRIEYITKIGTGGPSPQEGVTFNSTVKLDSRILGDVTDYDSSYNYIFSGWCDGIVTYDGCSGKRYDAGADYPIAESSRNVTLYAMWRKKNKVCFTAGTLVDTPNGLKTIEDLKRGDTIYSYNLDKKELTTDIVEETFRSIQSVLYKLTLDDGSVIQGTQFHPFYNWIDDNWQPLDYYRPGNKLYTIDGGIKTSSRLETISGERETYNLRTKEYYNYIIATSKDNKFLVLAVPPDDIYMKLIEENPQIVDSQIMPIYGGGSSYLPNP